jgi:hypothetical protein
VYWAVDHVKVTLIVDMKAEIVVEEASPYLSSASARVSTDTEAAEAADRSTEQ